MISSLWTTDSLLIHPGCFSVQTCILSNNL